MQPVVLAGLVLAVIVPCACGDAGGGDGGTSGPSTSVGTDSGPSEGGSSADEAGTSGATEPSGTETSDASASESGSSDDGGPPVTPGGPVLFFSDLANAPRSGNTDTSLGQAADADGAIITVWGKHLGDAQGDSTITVGGVDALVYSWGPAQQAADLYSRLGLQAIALQIPGSAPLGEAAIEVEVDGVPSNALPFVTRDAGAIRFVMPDGDDSGTGTRNDPWATFDRVAEAIDNGDVIYFGDGFVDASGQIDSGFFGLNTNGTAELPKALVAYPGATVTIGGDACEPTGHGLISNFSSALDGYTEHWVLSKLRVVSPEDCMQDTAVVVANGFRLVGNYLSTPRTTDGCQSGTVTCGGFVSCGNDIYILGNELADSQTTNAETGSKQCHGFYISGNRVEDGVESNREIAWNYIHDCGNNRAINIYNESINGEGQPRARIEGHRVHDNWLENQRGIGMLLGAEVTGDNWVYNNVFVNTGLGPEFFDGGGFFPFQLEPGSDYAPSPTNTLVSNNLVYGTSFPGGPEYAIGLLHFSQKPMVTLEVRNNVFVSTEDGIAYLSDSTEPFESGSNVWFGAGAVPSGDRSSIGDDPTFVDAAALDFHLAPNSPAKGSGVALDVGELDFDGIPREPDAWSIGPYQ